MAGTSVLCVDAEKILRSMQMKGMKEKQSGTIEETLQQRSGPVERDKGSQILSYMV